MASSSSVLAQFDKETLITILNLFSDEQIESMSDIDKEYVYSLIGKAKELFKKDEHIDIPEDEELRIGPTTNHPQVVRTVTGQYIGNSNMIELYNGLSKEDRIRAKNDAINTVDKGLQDLSGRILKRIYSDGPIRFWTNLVYTFGRKKYAKKDVPKYLYRPRRYNMQAHIQFHSDFLGAKDALLRGHYGTGGLKIMRTWYTKASKNNYLGYFKSLNSVFARTSFIYELLGSYCGFGTMNNITSYATFAKANLSTQTKHLWNEKVKIEKKLKGCGSSDAVCTKANFNSCNVNRCLDYLKKELEELNKKNDGKNKKPGDKYPNGDIPDVPIDEMNKWKDYIEWAGIALAIILALTMGGTAIGLANQALQSPTYIFRDYFMYVLRFLVPEDEYLINNDEEGVHYLGYLPKIKKLVDTFMTQQGGLKHSAGRKYNLKVYDDKIGYLKEIGDIRNRKLSKRIKGVAYWLKKHTKTLYTKLEEQSIDLSTSRLFGTSATGSVQLGKSTQSLYLQGNTITLYANSITEGTSKPLTNFVKALIPAPVDLETSRYFGTSATGYVCLGRNNQNLYLDGNILYLRPSSIAEGTTKPLTKFINNAVSFGTTATSAITLGSESQELTINASSITSPTLTTFVNNLIPAPIDLTTSRHFGTAATNAITIGTASQPLTLYCNGIVSPALTTFVTNNRQTGTRFGTSATSYVIVGRSTQNLYLYGSNILESSNKPLTTFINNAVSFGTAATSEITLGSESQDLTINASSITSPALTTFVNNLIPAPIDLTTSRHFGIRATGYINVGNSSQILYLYGSKINFGTATITEGTSKPLTNFITNSVTSGIAFGTSATSAVTLGSESQELTINASSITSSALTNFVNNLIPAPVNLTTNRYFGTGATGYVSVGSSSQNLYLNSNTLTLYANSITESTNKPLTNFVNNLIPAPVDLTTQTSFATAATDAVTLGNATQTLTINASSIKSTALTNFVTNNRKTGIAFGTGAADTVVVGNSTRNLSLQGNIVRFYANSIYEGTSKPLTNFITNLIPAPIDLTKQSAFGTASASDITFGSESQNLTINASSITSPALTNFVNNLIPAPVDLTTSNNFGTAATNYVTLGRTNYSTYIRANTLYLQARSIVEGTTKPLTNFVNNLIPAPVDLTSAASFGTASESAVTLGSTSASTTVAGSSISIGDSNSNVTIKGRTIEEWTTPAAQEEEEELVPLRVDEYNIQFGQPLQLNIGDYEYESVYIKKVAVNCNNNVRLSGLGTTITHKASTKYVCYPVNKKIVSTTVSLGSLITSTCTVRLFLYV